MDQRAIAASMALGYQEDEPRARGLMFWLFVALTFFAVLTLLVARATPALATTTTSSTSDDDDDDDDGSDGSGSGSGSGDDDDVEAARIDDDSDSDSDSGDAVRDTQSVDSGSGKDSDSGSGSVNNDSIDSKDSSNADSVGGVVIDRPDEPSKQDDTKTGDGGDDDDVLGKVVRRAVPKTPAAPQVQAGGAVAGESAAAPGGVLPFTGASVLAFLGSAAALIGAGSVLARRRRK